MVLNSALFFQQDVSTTGFYIYFNLEEGKARLKRSDLVLLAYVGYFLITRVIVTISNPLPLLSFW